MFKFIAQKSLYVQTAFIVGLVTSPLDAHAAGNDFGSIARNITNSIEELPGLVSGIAYLFGLLMGVTGILKLKAHVENPSNAPLKDGAVRLAAGGALFGLPIVFESMMNTIGTSNNMPSSAVLNKVQFRTQ